MSLPVKPSTLRQLRESGWQSKPVKREIHDNFLAALARGDELFPGIVGYDSTVIPEINLALLAGHDQLFLGEKGQGKSRLMRSIVRFLDPELPYLDIPSVPVHEDPYHPITTAGKRFIADHNETDNDLPTEESLGSEVLDETVPAERLGTLAEPSQNPEQQTLAREREMALRSALQRLGLAYRETVILRDIEGFTYEEIAATLKRDAIEIRRANCYGVEARNTTPYGEVVENNTLPPSHNTENYDAHFSCKSKLMLGLYVIKSVRFTPHSIIYGVAIYHNQFS